MVLQALRTFILIMVVSLSNIYAETGDMECTTTTDLDFTEKEACEFDALSQLLIEMSEKNMEAIGGLTTGVSSVALKYNLYGQSRYGVIANLDKAKALLQEKSSKEIKVIVDLILSEAEILKVISQLRKNSIENQIVINSLTKKGD